MCPVGESCTAVSRAALTGYNTALGEIAVENGLALADFQAFFAAATGFGPGVSLGGIHFDLQSSFVLLLEPDPNVQGVPGVLTSLARAVLAYLTVQALNDTYAMSLPLPDLCTSEPVPTLVALGHPLFPSGSACNP